MSKSTQPLKLPIIRRTSARPAAGARQAIQDTLQQLSAEAERLAAAAALEAQQAAAAQQLLNDHSYDAYVEMLGEEEAELDIDAEGGAASEGADGEGGGTRAQAAARARAAAARGAKKGGPLFSLQGALERAALRRTQHTVATQTPGTVLQDLAGVSAHLGVSMAQLQSLRLVRRSLVAKCFGCGRGV